MKKHGLENLLGDYGKQFMLINPNQDISIDSVDLIGFIDQKDLEIFKQFRNTYKKRIGDHGFGNLFPIGFEFAGIPLLQGTSLEMLTIKHCTEIIFFDLGNNKKLKTYKIYYSFIENKVFIQETIN